MINQSLSLSQEQRQIQIMAPQLRQSLELLQIPILELQTLVQKELQQNPAIEETPPETMNIEVEPGSNEMDDSKELDFKKEFDILSRIDDEWYNYFSQEQQYKPYDSSRKKKRDFFFDSQVQRESLQDHLAHQLPFCDLSKQDNHVGELIIGSINDDGYLIQNIEELAESSGVDPVHMQDILLIIQEFDPIGIGAHDLKECLLLQMERLGQESPTSALASTIIKDHLTLLGKKQFKEIAKTLKISLEDVLRAARLISTLEPKPGRAYSSETPLYILPEILVKKVNDAYIVVLNDDQIPYLRISKNYKQLMNNDSTAPDVKDYIKDKIRAGLFLIKSIEQRKHTLNNVASEIVKVQSDFFDSGITYLKPLTMSEVAKTVGIHETTVCRCIANKYMKTPRGMFEMKYFFTRGLKTDNGKPVSNKTVQDMIASLVANEDLTKPLSRDHILKQLKAQGIHVARRTVTKYRIALKIPPSHLRKSQ